MGRFSVVVSERTDRQAAGQPLSCTIVDGPGEPTAEAATSCAIPAKQPTSCTVVSCSPVADAATSCTIVNCIPTPSATSCTIVNCIPTPSATSCTVSSPEAAMSCTLVDSNAAPHQAAASGDELAPLAA